ncbi:MAG: pilus assembly protein PilM [Chitinispirillia bacterium]|jgi:Tfp pilus assembly PilM family ATPase
MAVRHNTLSGLELNKTSLCYTRCIPEDRLIANICIQPLHTGERNYWEAVSAGFSEFIKEMNIPGENIVVSLGGEFAIIKKIKIDFDETEVNEAIEWELSQHIIGSIEEYVYDYQFVNNDPSGDFKNFLVAGYREKIVDRVGKLLKSQRLNPIVIDIDIFALINVFEINYSDRKDIPSVIIFSELTSSKIILTMNGFFVDLEIFDHTDEMMNPDVFIEKLNDTMNLLFSYNQEFTNNESVNKYLSGSFFSQIDFTNRIIDKIPNTEVLFPFRNVSCSAGMDDEKLREFSPQLAVSVGLTLRDID